MANGEKITITIDATAEPLKRGFREADEAIKRSRQRIDDQVGQLANSFSRVDRAGSMAGGNLRNALNGVSMQMQDVVVQLSSGTNPLQVLIQQGGQIAGAFGPAFGPAGLLIAGAGAAALAFSALTGKVDTLKAAAEAADRTHKSFKSTLADQVDTADELAKKYRKMTDELRAFEQVSIGRRLRIIAEDQSAQKQVAEDAIRQIEQQRKLAEESAKLRGLGPLAGDNPTPEQKILRDTFAAIDRFREGGALTDLTVDLNKLAARAGEAGAPFIKVADALVDPARRMQELQKETDRLNAALRVLNGTATAADRETFNNSREGRGGGGKSDADRIRERIKALEFEAEQFRRNSREQAIYQALEQAGVDITTESGRRIAELAGRIYDLTEARQREAEAAKQATAEAERDRKEREAASERARKLLEDRDAIGRSYQQEIENNGLLIAALQQGNEAYREQVILLEILQRYRALGMPLVGEEIEQARELARTLAQQRGQLQEGQVSSRDFAFVLTSGFERAMQAGEGLRGTLAGILEDLAKIAARKAFLEPMSGLFDDAFSWIGSTIGGSLFGGGGLPGGSGTDTISLPARASGGPVDAGRAFLVGERGPEIFVPRVPGGIVPNHALGAMGGGSDVDVQIIDQRGANAPPVEVEQGVGSDGKRFIRATIRDEMKAAFRSGAMDRELAQQFGLRRQGRA